jgi:hypothetical protein
MAEQSEISKFLHIVKNVDLIDFVPTEKNRHTRLLLGLTVDELEEMIRNLKSDEYHSGPFKDKDPTKIGKVWIFKHLFSGHLLYIKLKERIIVEGNSIVKCLSCHIDYM